MAASKLAFSTCTIGFTLALPLAGCAPQDPVWSLPCDERPAREVQVGTGDETFVAADAEYVPIQNGSQGGQHIWMAVRVRGFGPEASLAYGILDAMDPAIVYSGPNQKRTQLQYNPEEEASEKAGLYGYLTVRYDPDTQAELPGPEHRFVTFWADVSDDCTTEPMHAEAPATVQ